MSVTTFQEAIDALEQLGCSPKKSGKGYLALCPIHEMDGRKHNPSLSINEGDTQPVVVNCFAGCDSVEILKRLKINGKSRKTPTTNSKPQKSKIADAVAKTIVDIYKYRTADGTEVREKVRYDPKNFEIRHRNAAGELIYKDSDGPKVLYRLPELKAAIAKGKTVFMCEGEKDAKRVASLGFASTTNIEGAAQPGQKAKWLDEYTEQLSGAARVILIPDNDGAGQAHMRYISTQLYSNVGDFRWLDLPGLSYKGDVSDWFDAGNTVEEFERLVSEAPKPDEVPQRTYEQEAKQKAKEDKKKLGTKALAILATAKLIEKSPEWIDVLAFDEFHGRIAKRQPPPFQQGKAGYWDEIDDAELTLWLAANGLTPSSEAQLKIVRAIAHRKAFNPAQERLKELESAWDHERRLDSWLVTYLNAQSNETNSIYLKEFGRCWLIGIVARVMKPGCKRDDVLTLVGSQSVGKSRTAKTIADAIIPEAFSDSLGDLGTDEARNNLRGKIIVEFAELSSVKRSQLEAVKAFITTQADSFRMKYERDAKDHPRTVSFIASTNDIDGFLTDTTGNRRWFPVVIESAINIEKLESALPQLIGEAVNAFHRGELWYLTNPIALAQAEGVRDTHREEDAIEPAVICAIAELTLSTPSIITVEGVMEHMRLDYTKRTQQMMKRIAAILRKEGYEKKRTRYGERLIWGWFKPKD